jgi:hypothetical protein
MEEQEEPVFKKHLTIEQTHEIMKYPFYWRGTLTEAAQRGESIEETLEVLREFDKML